MNIEHPTQDVRTNAKVVVIGSGAGGQFAALTLAEAGLDVLVLEAGRVWQPHEMPEGLSTAVARMYAEGGMRTMSGTPPLPIAGGEAFGGSTVVNSAICFRTPDHVIDQWNELSRGAFADTAHFRSTQEQVERVVQVIDTPDLLLSGNDRSHRRAAAALGWSNGNFRRNTPGCGGCGRCNTGCPVGGKASVDRFVWPRAARAGARAMTGCQVHSIQPGRIQGVVVDERRQVVGTLEVTCDHIVLAAGAISTPQLLLDSGLVPAGGEVGFGLQIHPVVSVHALLPWPNYDPGTTQGHYIDEHDEHRVLLEANPVLPGGFFQGLPVVGPEGMAVLRQAAHLVSTGAMVRDTSQGRVSAGSPGRASVSYSISAEDRDRMIKGFRLGAELWLDGAQAERVALTLYGTKWCKTMKEVESLTPADLDPASIMAYASHPQASCSVGRCLDETGRVLGVDGISVADASALPTNVGRNPQISVMTVSRLLTERLAESLGGQPQPLL